MITAKLEDKYQIMELYRELILTQVDFEQDFFQVANQTIEFIEEMITNEDSDILLVFNNQEEIVGFSVIKQMQSPNYPMFKSKNYAYIFDLIVTKQARGNGFAKELLKVSIDWGKERELDYIELAVLNKNEKADHMYNNFGFRVFSKQMIYELS